ncbi:MAG: hypothetical protein QOE37_2259 [Microbacteriaceae bacterium]|nr:hypothetical protein [Microbacteriaceae bacterium]
MLSDRHADLYHEVRRKPRRGSVSVSWPVREGVLLTSNRLRSWAERVYTQVDACSVLAWWVRVGEKWLRGRRPSGLTWQRLCMPPVTTASAGTHTSMVMYSARTAYELSRSWHGQCCGRLRLRSWRWLSRYVFPMWGWFLCARGRIYVS